MRYEKKKPTLAKMVKQIVAGKSETKYAIGDVLNATQVNWVIAPNDWQPGQAAIGIGPGTFQRIGERVANVKARVHLRFGFSSQQTATNDYYVKIFYGYYNSLKNYQDRLSVIRPNTLLDNGDGTSRDWDNVGTTGMSQSLQPVFKNAFRLKQKFFRMTNNVGISSGDTTAGNAPNLSTSQHKQVVLKFDHKSSLKYQDASVRFPENWCPIWAAVAWEANGANPNGSRSPVYWWSRTDMTYKDV
jgi:hypothetical protein